MVKRYAVSAVVRTAVIVSDRDRSLAFYRDLLGLIDVYVDGEIHDPVAGSLPGLPDPVALHFAIV